jgi:GR25 family glycosyltransferase involved in LPS biosynthesis
VNEKIIDFYVITNKNNIRLKNIEEQENKINKNSGNSIKIIKIDAVMGVDLDLNKLVSDGILSEKYIDYGKQRRGQIGCYISHHKIYHIIHDKKKYDNYSIIFEDDFNIVVKDFMDKINNAIYNLEKISFDFDMLFLQNNHYDESNRGEKIIDNIYHFNPNQPFYGTLAILINNKNIKKIINNTKFIEVEIDQKLRLSAINNELNIIVMNPVIVEQHRNIDSIITYSEYRKPFSDVVSLESEETE